MSTLRLFSMVGGEPRYRVVIEGVPPEVLTPQAAFQVFKAVKEKYKLRAAKSYTLITNQQVFSIVRGGKGQFKVYELTEKQDDSETAGT